jgi:WD40 repeat protein
MEFSPDGRQLAVGGGQPSRNGQLQIWDVVDGTLLHEFDQPHSDTVLAVRFSPDGRYLASGAADRFLRVFDVRSFELAGTFEGHTHHVLSVDWQLDGRRLATGSADQTVKLWDFREKRQIRTIEGFGKDVTAVRFIAATEEFFAACADQSVARCNGEGNREVIARSDAYLYCLATPAGGEHLVTGSHTGAVEVLDAKGNTMARFTGQE